MRFMLIAFSIVQFVSSGVTAEVTAVRLSGNGTATVSEPSPGVWNVTIDIPSSTEAAQHRWLIEADDEDHINLIRVRSCPALSPDVTKPTFLIVRPTGSGSIVSLGNVQQTRGLCTQPGSHVVLEELVVNGDVVGQITVHAIELALVEGSVLGSIFTGVSAVGEQPSVEGIVSLVIEGDLHDDIISAGPIGSIEISGIVEKLSGNISIIAPSLGRLVCAAFAGSLEIDDAVGRIEVSGGSQSVFTGSFQCMEFASIDPQSQPAGLYIDGDFSADMTLTSALTHPITVGGSFGYGASITLPTSGLQSQIRFNNRDTTANWSGTISVGATDLTVPAYPATATTIGGGAAGLVPYDLHETSCEPPHDSFIFVSGIDIMDPELNCVDYPFTEAILRAYGPVEFVGSPPYFEVQTHDGSVWQTASFTLDATIVSGSEDRRIRSSVPAIRPGPLACTPSRFLRTRSSARVWTRPERPMWPSGTTSSNSPMDASSPCFPALT